jgi:hypothetical protein
VRAESSKGWLRFDETKGKVISSIENEYTGLD